MLNQPTSSPMMKMMFGFAAGFCAAAGDATKKEAMAALNNKAEV